MVAADVGRFRRDVQASGRVHQRSVHSVVPRSATTRSENKANPFVLLSAPPLLAAVPTLTFPLAPALLVVTVFVLDVAVVFSCADRTKTLKGRFSFLSSVGACEWGWSTNG